MTDHLITSVVSILTAIVGLAILAVLVSSKASTSNVISAAGTAFANDLSAAEAPVTGGSSSGISIPSLGGWTGQGGAAIPSLM